MSDTEIYSSEEFYLEAYDETENFDLGTEPEEYFQEEYLEDFDDQEFDVEDYDTEDYDIEEYLAEQYTDESAKASGLTLEQVENFFTEDFISEDFELEDFELEEFENESEKEGFDLENFSSTTNDVDGMTEEEFHEYSENFSEAFNEALNSTLATASLYDEGFDETFMENFEVKLNEPALAKPLAKMSTEIKKAGKSVGVEIKGTNAIAYNTAKTQANNILNAAKAVSTGVVKPSVVYPEGKKVAENTVNTANKMIQAIKSGNTQEILKATVTIAQATKTPEKPVTQKPVSPPTKKEQQRKEILVSKGIVPAGATKAQVKKIQVDLVKKGVAPIGMKPQEIKKVQQIVKQEQVKTATVAKGAVPLGISRPELKKIQTELIVKGVIPKGMPAKQVQAIRVEQVIKGVIPKNVPAKEMNKIVEQAKQTQDIKRAVALGQLNVDSKGKIVVATAAPIAVFDPKTKKPIDIKPVAPAVSKIAITKSDKAVIVSPKSQVSAVKITQQPPKKPVTMVAASALKPVAVPVGVKPQVTQVGTVVSQPVKRVVVVSKPVVAVAVAGSKKAVTVTAAQIKKVQQELIAQGVVPKGVPKATVEKVQTSLIAKGVVPKGLPPAKVNKIQTSLVANGIIPKNMTPTKVNNARISIIAKGVVPKGVSQDFVKKAQSVIKKQQAVEKAVAAGKPVKNMTLQQVRKVQQTVAEKTGRIPKGVPPTVAKKMAKDIAVKAVAAGKLAPVNIQKAATIAKAATASGVKLTKQQAITVQRQLDTVKLIGDNKQKSIKEIAKNVQSIISTATMPKTSMDAKLKEAQASKGLLLSAAAMQESGYKKLLAEKDLELKRAQESCRAQISKQTSDTAKVISAMDLAHKRTLADAMKAGLQQCPKCDNKDKKCPVCANAILKTTSDFNKKLAEKDNIIKGLQAQVKVAPVRPISAPEQKTIMQAIKSNDLSTPSGIAGMRSEIAAKTQSPVFQATLQRPVFAQVFVNQVQEQPKIACTRPMFFGGNMYTRCSRI